LKIINTLNNPCDSKGSDVKLGRVVGNVVSTRKNDKLVGAKLLLIKPIAKDFVNVPLTLAVDTTQAGIGDTVLYVLEGKAAGAALRRRAAPVDAAIVGIVDYVTSSNKN
tara:strand:- start:11143 stop:11469 length:327 start_codon:yes stop_codon:yes gene_type:complete